MPCLVVTTEQLEREFVRVFADGQDAPAKCWLDHFHDYHSFLRAVYPESFSARAVDRMMALRSTLQDLYGTGSTVSIVIFLHDAPWDDFAAHRLWIHTV